MEDGVERVGRIASDVEMRKENIYFPCSAQITKEEFDQIPRDFSFNFVLGDGDKKSIAGFRIRGERLSLSITITSDSREILNQEKLKMFAVKNNGRTLIYPAEAEGDYGDEISGNESESYTVDGLNRRVVDLDPKEINEMSIENVAEILKSTPGDEVIFYTGAGISMGGENSVWGMAQLDHELGGVEGVIDSFWNPEGKPPGRILDRFRVFKNQLFGDTSTPAHQAIADYINNKEDGVVFTENIDLKHEAEGSRISAIHTGNKDSFNKLKLRAHRARLLVVVGLSRDERAVIQYLKVNHPAIKILAFTLSKETIPNYLDENDSVVLGDVQEVLPRIMEKVKES